MSRFKNPIYEKDRWSANRSRTFFFAVVGVNAIITIIAVIVFINMVWYMKTSSMTDYTAFLQLYLTLAMAECLMIVLITPTLAGMGISQERENGNLEIFFSSGVTPYQVVFGKFVSCMNMLFVLLVTSLPVFSLVFVYGGIRMSNLIMMIVILLIVALEVCACSIMCSARAKSSAQAVVSAYGINLLIIAGTIFIHLAPSFLYQASYGESLGSPVAWYHYLLLANPVVTFYGVLNVQAGSRTAIFDMINYMGNYRQNWIIQNWLPVSLCVQAAVVAIELTIAARSVNNSKKKFQRGVRSR